MSAEASPQVSIVVPVYNEEGAAGPLAQEIAAAFAGVPHEIVFVDDASRDATREQLRALQASLPQLRVLRHRGNAGQSRAVRTGVLAASGPIVVTLDGDGQNDPAFIPTLVEALERGGPGVGLVAGQRVGRRDTGFKRLQSRIANRVRAAVLKDGTRDTGCGLKAVRRDLYFLLPYFDALHRFMPALVAREGLAVVHVDVVDRPRLAGRSKYGFFDRLLVGIGDLAGVWWLLRRRHRTPRVEEIA